MKTSKSLKKSQFTLLELIIVIAILAIVAGGLMVAYDGLESKAAKGQATHGIAAVDQAVRTFTTIEGTAPNNLDSLIAADFGDPSTNNEALGILGSKIAGKLEIFGLEDVHADALTAAGINSIRYVDIIGNGEGLVNNLDVLAVDGTAAAVGPLSEIDIPNRAFDGPRPGANRNRGRGFESAVTTNNPVMTWIPGDGGINNIKVGAAADDVLVALGIGNNASLVGGIDGGTPQQARLANAPFYGDVAQNEYSRYVALYNVGGSPSGIGGRIAGSARSVAKLQAVVDTRGDFLDEEYAEYTGQKQ